MTANLDWMDDAPCTGIPGFTELDEEDQQRACRTCPVRLQCLSFAVTGPMLVINGPRDPGWPVHGGLPVREVVRRQRSMRVHR